MRVALEADGPVRLWHDRLRDRLAAEGHAFVVRRRQPLRGPPMGLGALLAAERRLYGGSVALWRPTAGGDSADPAHLVLEPRFDGVAGERALIEALLARRAPRVDIVDIGCTPTRRLATGLPAVETPDILRSALDHVLARVVTLVIEAVRNAVAGAAPRGVSDASASRAAFSPPLFGARTLGGKLLGRLRPAGGRLPQWRIATRVASEPGAAKARGWTGMPFAEMVHDGLRFQADPFLYRRDGRTFVFFEDFPHATRKGVIGVCELDAAGRPGPARVALEEPFHLSYPYVFAHEGDIYMLPETSADGRIRLYRANPFPDRWVRDHVLVEGVEASDATLISHGGHLWLFATLSGDGGSSWDALGLFRASHLFGPWTPHPRNPVLVDAGAARPAGAMWRESGALMRVAQDCRSGYGDGLAICRVDRLDGEGYAQTLVARLAPPAGSGATGVHTFNRADGFEAIDLR